MKTKGKHPNGLLASIAIQCTFPETGQTGDWLFSGESHRNAGSAKSPLFADLQELFQWMNGNDWTEIGSRRYIYHDFNDLSLRGQAVENAMLAKHSNAI